ncbi:hypothetical protein HNQ85_002017 [Anoxybacillus calidus]|jgi:hypothetical protein|uniref:Uncharacterized protein n=1 Tax=[Anoxybacillus] calidus TaxID=575178 RepID=A0A7V9Z0C2_9BACL|nr:hypothetical protein [Anoxybacillus calidus]MBA2871742.1 hypothetical protein [Anoxybacillus calidus]
MPREREILYYDEEAALEISQQIASAYHSGMVDRELIENPHYRKKEQQTLELD